MTNCCLLQHQILMVSAVVEIAAGFVLLLLLLHRPFQYLILVIVYCGLHLPACCWMPETAAYHKQARALSYCSIHLTSAEFKLVS